MATLNDDCISVINTFYTNADYIKELKQKNMDKYSALIKEGIGGRHNKYEVGNIYYEENEIQFIKDHIHEIDNSIMRSVEYQKITRVTKCYVFYEHWFYDTLTKEHRFSKKDKRWIEKSELWGDHCYNIRDNCLKKISHLEYLVQHYEAFKEMYNMKPKD